MRFLVLLATLLGGSASLFAADDEEPASGQDEPPARERYFLLPIDIDTDSGAANGDAVIGRVLPTVSIPLRNQWTLLNLGIVTIADTPGGRPGSPGNPEALPGERVFGIGDLIDAVMFKKVGASWGAGMILTIPTATDDALGSGKWSAGPALLYLKKTGPWIFNVLAGDLRSFAGDDNRADIHQLMMRVTVRRTFGEKWFFIYSPIITANWNASSSQRWLVPLGGGIGRQFVGTTPVNVSLQFYNNVVRPDGAPRSVVRLGFTIPFRLPDMK